MIVLQTALVGGGGGGEMYIVCTFLFLLHALVISQIVSIWNDNTTYHEPPAPTFAEVTA